MARQPLLPNPPGYVSASGKGASVPPGFGGFGPGYGADGKAGGAGKGGPQPFNIFQNRTMDRSNEGFREGGWRPGDSEADVVTPKEGDPEVSVQKLHESLAIRA